MTGALATLLCQAGLCQAGLCQAGGTEGADGLAGRLRAHGIGADEPVLLQIGNRPGDLAALLGVWLAGGVAVPVHVSAAPHTVAALRQATGARLAVDGAVVEVIAAHPPPGRALLRGAALVVFTSGTTGRQKGVVIGHDALAGKLGVLGRLLALRPEDIVVVPLQLTFIFGIWVALLARRSGARLVLVPKFSRPAIEAVVAEGATVLAAVPSMLRMLMAPPPAAAGRLRLLLTGGEALGPALGQGIGLAWPGVGVFDLYGSTETGSCDFAHHPAAGSPEGAIGRPTEGVTHAILAGDGSPAPPGSPGELAIQTPYGMAGYLDDPALTRDAFAGSYFRTGDLARLLPDGSVALVGRLKEIVSRGGNKVALQEIDNLLGSHPDVVASLTAGVPDTRLGEALHTVVVLADGAVATPATLRAWLAERIERYKVPDVIELGDALPTGPTGKASRAALRAGLLVRREG